MSWTFSPASSWSAKGRQPPLSAYRSVRLGGIRWIPPLPFQQFQQVDKFSGRCSSHRKIKSKLFNNWLLGTLKTRCGLHKLWDRLIYRFGFADFRAEAV